MTKSQSQTAAEVAFAAAARTAAQSEYGTVFVAGEEFTVLRKPSLLMFAEIMRIEKTGRVHLIPALIERALGTEQYDRVFTLLTDGEKEDDGQEQAMNDLVGSIVEQTMGRPTE